MLVSKKVRCLNYKVASKREHNCKNAVRCYKLGGSAANNILVAIEK